MRGGRRRKDYTPVSWDKYFEHQEEIKVSETKVSFTFVQTSGTYSVRIHFVWLSNKVRDRKIADINSIK